MYAAKILPILKFISTTILCIFFLPLIVLPFFNHASTDDYVFGIHVNELGFFPYQHFIYNEWGGRFSATFVIGLFAKNGFLYTHYYVHTLVLLVLDILSIFLLISVLNRFILKDKIIQNKKCLITFSYFALSVCCCPELSTFLFWFSSAVTYHLPVILLQTEIALFILLFNTSNKISAWVCRIFIPVLIFFISGFNELFIIIQFLLLALAFYIDVEAKLSNIFKTVLFLFFICSTMLVILAPGNEIRSGLPPSKGFGIGLAVVVYHIAEICWAIFRNPFFWLALVAVFISGNRLNETLKQQLWYKKIMQKKWLIPLLIALLLIGSVAGAVRGLKGGIVADRYINTVTYFTMMSFLFYSFIIGITLQPLHSFFDFLKPWQPAIIYGSLAVVLFANTYVVNAYKSVISAPVYHSIMSEREKALAEASAKGSEAILKSYNLALQQHLDNEYARYPYTALTIIRERPALLFFADDLDSDYSTQMLKQFYGIDSLTIKRN